jgi:hypothetical protein
MKGQIEHVTEKLVHALIFVQLAKETPYLELREQHLDEAERLLGYAVDTLKGMHGKATS